MKALSNREYAERDRCFIKACALARVAVTRRQASKYRREPARGRAVLQMVNAIQAVCREVRELAEREATDQ